MGKRYFAAVYTECNCILACSHKHPNVTTATACICEPGGYVVAVRRRKLLPLTSMEEAEFQAAMYGRRGSRPNSNTHDPRLVAGESAAKA